MAFRTMLMDHILRSSKIGFAFPFLCGSHKKVPIAVFFIFSSASPSTNVKLTLCVIFFFF